ncbi:MAG TPA: CAP domain-containing protein [Cytophagales bacterium]|nr:CAP domain-containing protein [Cytophagales bacterium]
MISVPLFAQDPNEKIVFSAFNETYFKDRLLTKLNHIRDTLKVPLLIQDDFLVQPAEMHAKYLVKTSQVTNVQEGKYPYVEDRVNYFKGNYGTLGQLSAAANVGKTTFLKKENKKVTYETYEEVIEGIIKDIFNYSNNRKYIDNPNFTNVGLALGIDEPGKRIYAVFVLSNKPYLAPIGVKVPDNAYGIKSEEDEKCSGAKNILRRIPNSVEYGAYIENGEIFFHMSDIAWFNRLFEESVDAIAIDLINKDQYPCHSSNIQHKSPIHDGVLLPPVKAKTIIKGNKKLGANAVLASVGKVPTALKNGEGYEANVLFLKSKCSCAYTKPVTFAPDSLKMLHMGLYVDTINPDNEVYLDENPNKIKYSFSAADMVDATGEVERLTKFLGKSRQYDFKRISFVSYYPINADPEKSKELCSGIASNLVYKLQQNQPEDTIAVSNLILPRWLDFYKAINKTKNEPLKYLPRPEILKKINESAEVKQSLDSVLNKPFKFDLTIELQVERLKFNQPFDVLKTKIDEAAAKGNKEEVYTHLKTLFNEIHHKVVGKKEILKLEIPRKPEFIDALIALESFKYLYKINDATYSYDEFVRLNGLSPGNKMILYNMAVLNIIKSFEAKDKLKSFDAIYTDIQSVAPYNVNKKLIHKLNANYYFLKAYKEHKNSQPKRRQEAVKSAASYCIAEELTEQNLEIAINNYSFFSDNEAIGPFMEKIVVNDNIAPEVILDYIKQSLPKAADINAELYNLALENAYTLASGETCDLFATNKGSFQLKENKVLKEFFCRHCK